MTNRKSPRLQSYKKMMVFDKNWPSNLSSRATPLTTRHANDKKLTTIWALSSPKAIPINPDTSDLRSNPIIHSVIISELHENGGGEEEEEAGRRRRRRGRRSVYLTLFNPLPVQLKLSSVVDKKPCPQNELSHRPRCPPWDLSRLSYIRVSIYERSIRTNETLNVEVNQPCVPKRRLHYRSWQFCASSASASQEPYIFT